MLSFYFPPSYSGSAIQALNLSLQLTQRGVTPFVLSANLTGSPAREIVRGIEVHRIPVLRSPELQIPSFWASAARFLWRRRQQFDLIHAHGTVQHGIGAIVGRLLGKPTILKIAMAGSDIAFARQGRLTGRVNRFAVERFDRYIATTTAIQDEISAEGLEARCVRLIPNGVDTAAFSPATDAERAELRRELGLPLGPIVACVAIINERKNIDGILRIWRELVGRDTAGHLVLIGPIHTPGGRYERRLHEYIDTHGLGGRVSFLGRREPVIPYLRASDVFVFPSRQEGMPNSVLEAMACGVPCVVSRSAGAEQAIRQGESGFLIDVADEPGFAEVIAALLRDSERRRQIGARARAVIELHFSLERIADRYVELYGELLAQGPAPSR